MNWFKLSQMIHPKKDIDWNRLWVILEKKLERKPTWEEAKMVSNDFFFNDTPIMESIRKIKNKDDNLKFEL